MEHSLNYSIIWPVEYNTDYITCPETFLISNSSWVQLFNQNYLLLQENVQLKSEIQRILTEKTNLQIENQHLRRRSIRNRESGKRKYTKRRNWLQKKYKCIHNQCNCCYSSRIALNLHLRKRHSQVNLQEP